MSLNTEQEASTCELQEQLITGTMRDGTNHSIANKIENVECRGSSAQIIEDETDEW